MYVICVIFCTIIGKALSQNHVALKIYDAINSTAYIY